MKWLTASLFAILLYLITSEASVAQPLPVEFDVSPSAVFTGLALDGTSDWKLIQVVLEISVRSHVAENLIEEIEFQLFSTSQGFIIQDYLPNTTLTEVGRGFQIVVKKESRGLQGEASLHAGLAKFIAGGLSTDLNASAWDTTDSEIRSEMLLPKRLVVASGTMESGHGLFVRFRPNPRDSIQRKHRIVLLARVPADFHGGIFYVHCRSKIRGIGSGIRLSMATVIGVHSEGDVAKTKIAANLAARLNSDEVKSLLSAYSSFWERLWSRTPKSGLEKTREMQGIEQISLDVVFDLKNSRPPEQMLKNSNKSHVNFHDLVHTLFFADMIVYPGHLLANPDPFIFNGPPISKAEEIRLNRLYWDYCNHIRSELLAAHKSRDQEKFDEALGSYEQIANSSSSLHRAHFDIADHLELLEMSERELSTVDIDNRMDRYSIKRAGKAAERFFNDLKEHK